MSGSKILYIVNYHFIQPDRKQSSSGVYFHQIFIFKVSIFHGILCIKNYFFLPWFSIMVYFIGFLQEDAMEIIKTWFSHTRTEVQVPLLVFISLLIVWQDFFNIFFSDGSEYFDQTCIMDYRICRLCDTNLSFGGGRLKAHLKKAHSLYERYPQKEKPSKKEKESAGTSHCVLISEFQNSFVATSIKNKSISKIHIFVSWYWWLNMA